MYVFVKGFALTEKTVRMMKMITETKSPMGVTISMTPKTIGGLAAKKRIGTMHSLGKILAVLLYLTNRSVRGNVD